jgi:hypothetical protein
MSIHKAIPTRNQDSRCLESWWRASKIEDRMRRHASVVDVFVPSEMVSKVIVIFVILV